MHSADDTFHRAVALLGKVAIRGPRTKIGPVYHLQRAKLELLMSSNKRAQLPNSSHLVGMATDGEDWSHGNT